VDPDDAPSDARPVGPVLRAWRKRALLSQEQLAERAGLSVRTIRRLESGGQAGRHYGSSLRMVADALGLSDAERATLAATSDGTTSDVAAPAGSDVPSSAADRSVPRQLPSDVRGFTGRAADIARLATMVEDAGEPAPIVISAIDGTAGIGKTALAVHWAHRVKRHFPDGQLYLNLRGYGPGEPMDPEDALAAMLRSLGVDRGRIPEGADERSALLRTTLATRRTLILLDNARDSDQVRPLLPGSDALVLVTSRRKLRALAVRDGARHLTLDLLPEPEAVALLAGAIGADRVDAEPTAATEIVRLCACLPLALRLAAERINGLPPIPLRDVVADLTAHKSRLAALSIDESADTDLRSVFAWSHESLEPDAARMFDVLGLYPGGSIAVAAAAALAGVAPAAAATTFAQLVAVNMLEQRFSGRYELHDLLREYARERAEEHVGDRSAARHRLVGWYVHTAANACGQLVATPHGMPIADPPEGVAPERFGDHQAAVEWFDAELDAIIEIIQTSADHGHHRDGAVLGRLIWHYLYLRGRWQQMRMVGEVGVELAVAIGDALLEARIRNGLSVPYGFLPGFGEQEIATSRRALSIFEDLGDRGGQAGCLLNLGGAYNTAGRYAEAREVLERARDLYEQDGNRLYAAFALNNLAGTARELGLLDDALTYARCAVVAIRGSSEPFRVVTALIVEARVHAALGDHDAAVGCFREALATAESLGNTHRAIQLRVELGRELSAAGARGEAVDVWREAYRICVERDDPAIEEVRSLLGDQPAPPIA
jgi:tetratricopeptide (TPR) repeat protein/transcriptional regulator with XRE-family HTH domain